MKKALFILVALIPFLLSGCLPTLLFESLAESEVSFPPPELLDEEESLQEEGSFLNPFAYQYEALDWLSRAESPRAFADSRFKTTDEAISFVKGLYSKDAVVVMVTDIIQYADGEPYADALLVVMPKEPHSRAALQSAYHREVVLFNCNNGDEALGVMGDTLMMQWYGAEEED